MSQEILSTKRFFQSRDIKLSEFWLESCISWFRSENSNTNYTPEVLHEKVFQQWLLLDLRDVEIATLPTNLAQQKKCTLNGIFPLQIMSIVDISRPKFSQLQKIRNVTMFNHVTAEEEWTVTSKRMLLLTLTDGVTQVEAIEYSPIKSLNLNLAPGKKVKIIGPVVVRRGQLLLEEKHVQVLDGEVEELLVSNAPENILARALNLPENPNPNACEDNLVAGNSDPRVPPTNSSVTSGTNLRQWAQTGPSTSRNSVTSTSRVPQYLSNNTISKEEEEMIASEINMMMEAEFDVLMDEQTRRVDSFVNQEPVASTSGVTNFKSCDSTSLSCTNMANLEFEDSIFEDMDIDKHLDMIDEQLSQESKIKVYSIREIADKLHAVNDKYIIRAKFVSVIQKLTVTNNSWLLKIKIEDDTGEMEVFVHTDVITNLMGYSPASIMALKAQILNKNEEATKTVMKTMEDLKEKIIQLDCLVETTYTADKCLTITELK